MRRGQRLAPKMEPGRVRKERQAAETVYRDQLPWFLGEEGADTTHEVLYHAGGVYCRSIMRDRKRDNAGPILTCGACRPTEHLPSQPDSWTALPFCRNVYGIYS
jgi:hypothetical protein